jgi:hypothetical protein
MTLEEIAQKTGTTECSIGSVLTSDGVVLYSGSKTVFHERTAHTTFTGFYSSVSALVHAHPEYAGTEVTGQVTDVAWDSSKAKG